jgi:hypothetical protein
MVEMSRKKRARSECLTWAYAVQVMGKSVEDIVKPEHWMTEEDKVELKKILRHLQVSNDALQETCLTALEAT